ncbi:hypothetical protein J7E70_07820 [Variovorax paradoxus]|nr:hypothetical protein [Variovorax paradoxus]MBT2300370.1 hypothetical protein [Variovorax paradoxus]
MNADTAAAAFEAAMQPPKDEVEEVVAPTQTEAEEAAEAGNNTQEEGDDAPTSEAEGDEIVTVIVDGKSVELTKAQIAEAHKSGLRQADYTKKTTELAEQRKAAEAETAKARTERQELAQNLTRHQALLEGALQEQQKTDWQALLESDPVEYLKQQHLAQSRQAALQQTIQQKAALDEQANAEYHEGLKAHIASQREELLAKIPEWKNEAKMKAGVAELKDYLVKQGLSEAEVNGVTDHRAIVQARKAMLYDQMIAKASVAAKKVAAAPQRVERAAGGESNAIDKRTAAFQRLSKSGSVEDAGNLFASIL